MRTLLTALGLGLGLTWATAQSLIALNYASGFGDCELDTDQDGFADGWSVSHSFGDQNWASIGVFPSLSVARRFTGERSQQITINRASGVAGRVLLQTRPIKPSDSLFILPPEGTPLLTRIRVQTENLAGVTVRISALSGESQYVLADSLPANTGGWQTLSRIIPLQRDANNALRLYLTVEINLQAGAASGRVWLDALEVLWLQYPAPNRARPNMLKIAHVNAPVPNWQMLLSPPVDLLIAPIEQVLALRPYRQDAVMAIYINAFTTADQPSWRDLYGGYEYILRNHPSWFLTSQGNPMRNPNEPDSWLLNIGLPEVRQRAVQRLDEMNQNFPLPEWLFFDNAGSWWPCDQYPTRNDILPRWTEFFQVVFSHVRQNLGRKVIFNGGSHAGAYLDGNEGANRLQYVDGVILEHVITLFGGDPRTYRYQVYRRNSATSPYTDASWWATLRAINTYPNKTWVIMPMVDPNHDLNMFRYALASYFVMAHEKTYLMLEARGSENPNKYHLWLSRPEVWIPLGNPTGSWRVVAGTATDASGALFARDFQYGVVLVNPTEQQTYSFTLPRAYKNWDGQVIPAGTRIDVGPKTGLAFYAAPEVSVTISPQQVTALPGETVTFTVLYRNDGLADATNVQISIPLPEGLVFVSGSSGAQFANGRITWTLPQVRAGASGTLTFQAQVQ